jgi:hypothetical protein
LEGLFVGLLVTLAEIPPVAAVVTVENLQQLILRQPFCGFGGREDLPEGKAWFHEAVGHGGSVKPKRAVIKLPY